MWHAYSIVRNGCLMYINPLKTLLQVYVSYLFVHRFPISGNTMRAMWVVWKKAKNPSRSSLALKLFLKIFGLNWSDSTFCRWNLRDLKFLDMLSLPCVFCSKKYRPNSATSRISMFLRRFFTIYMSSERDSTELLLKHHTITFQLQHLQGSLKAWVFFACPLPPSFCNF